VTKPTHSEKLGIFLAITTTYARVSRIPEGDQATSIGVIKSKIAATLISQSQIVLLTRFSRLLQLYAKNEPLSAKVALQELSSMSGSGLQQ